MKERHYLVTGASSGIGLAIVECLLGEGAEVTAIARRSTEPALSKDKHVISRLTSIRCDLEDFSELESAMKALLGGEIGLDGAVFCHGHGDFGSLEEFSVERIVSLVNTNLLSHMLVARHIVPHLKRRGEGDLVFIGSESGVRGGKMGAVYSATKHAINGFAESLRAECASSNLRVSVINPGAVDSHFFDGLDFCPGDLRENYIAPDDVAQMATTILKMPRGTVIDKVNLTPLKKVLRKK
ncbi:MAG: SDR family NAD(P)-dependent oxidoreductase [Gammaproteobacteria bacterium]|nr:SDR family NAD(P)-dependent oxidoreductase [Gammaproteobacteria bacterium]